MAEDGVHRLEVEAVLSDPEATEIGEHYVGYHGRVADRRFRIIVVKESDPPLVMMVLVFGVQ